jgi:hypothetical protein
VDAILGTHSLDHDALVAGRRDHRQVSASSEPVVLLLRNHRKFHRVSRADSAIPRTGSL